MKKRVLLQGCFILLLALAGCSTTSPQSTAPATQKQQAAKPQPAPKREKAFETILAAARPGHPRQSEGDVIALKDGTLLAAWTDFSGSADHAPATIAAATSKDGGHTWSAPYELQPNIGQQNVMSASFLRTQTGKLLFFFLVKNSDQDMKVVVRSSTNEAKSWSAPIAVTGLPGYHIMNNARAVQLKMKRILCPVSFYKPNAPSGNHLRATMYGSDDDGKTWLRGYIVVDCPGRGAMEPGVVELTNKIVLQVIRTQAGQIWTASSPDNASSWTKPKPSGIVSPEAPSTIGRLPTGELVLIYNPSVEHGISGMASRTPLACSISKDEGATWSTPKLIESDLTHTYSYVSLTFVGDRALLTYYISEKGIGQASLKFKSIPVSWFTE